MRKKKYLGQSSNLYNKRCFEFSNSISSEKAAIAGKQIGIDGKKEKIYR